MVPFWIPIIRRHLIFRVPQKGIIILITTHLPAKSVNPISPSWPVLLPWRPCFGQQLHFTIRRKVKPKRTAIGKTIITIITIIIVFVLDIPIIINIIIIITSITRLESMTLMLHGKSWF